MNEPKTTSDISRIRQRICLLKKERNELEDSLLTFKKKMIRGALVKIFTKCHTPNCKCQKGSPHGPFLYVNVIVKGKAIHKYVGKKEDIKLVESLKRYKIFKDKLTRLSKVTKELRELWGNYRSNLREEIVDVK
jgi:hypothetical protein